MSVIRRLIHRIAHLLNWNHGCVDSRIIAPNAYEIFFRCSCGKESGHATRKR